MSSNANEKFRNILFWFLLIIFMTNIETCHRLVVKVKPTTFRTHLTLKFEFIEPINFREFALRLFDFGNAYRNLHNLKTQSLINEFLSSISTTNISFCAAFWLRNVLNTFIVKCDLKISVLRRFKYETNCIYCLTLVYFLLKCIHLWW